MAKQEIKKVDEQELQQLQAIHISPDLPLVVQVTQMLANGIDIDVDKIDKVLSMADRREDKDAKKAFFSAMSLAQAAIESIYTNKVNPQTNSKYATLDTILEFSKPIYAKHGFSVVFSEGETSKEGYIRICADLMHKDGHERPYYRDLPLDDKGIKGSVNKTQIHGKASSFSYGRRYLMCDIWNISTPDDDGNGAYPKPGPAAPTVRPPSTTELEVIDAICAKLPGKAGHILNKGRITARLIEKSRDYLLFDKVDWCSEQVMKHFSDVDLYEISNSVDEMPGTFVE